MARITKAEKLKRVNMVRAILSRGGTRSECLEFAATEWGLKPRSADFYIHEANQQIVQDFDIDRKEYTAQLLQVLHNVMEKGAKTNQMGAVTAAVAQAMKLARLDR
ncbi:hypothetical protein SynMEDNS5_01823 [Synechococcus sp. MEDNS5]|uniref:hypothetical protein n=1 Tax=Synechococcus sp. MEDNS5 TaxID=1442554 RepID=UPI001644F591|nr:hypothetical protein [Synechococcus sp. MEDNS5]QNJ06538.1 hypothetical protein SynMEDNS5_01823 [Synechococcus sp. MEDNS5]